MGIVCEFYLVKDQFINGFLENPKEFEDDFCENYTNPDGKFHNEGVSNFYIDKAWDIASFLIQENDTSPEKILNGLLGQPLENLEGLSYIKAFDAAKMNEIMRLISFEQIDEAYNEEKMKNPYVYNAGYFTKENSWDYILNHVKIIFEAFKKAAEDDKGIIISKS